MRITTLVPLVSLIGILSWIGWNKTDTSTHLHFSTSTLPQPSPTSAGSQSNNSIFSSSPFTSPLPQSSTSPLLLACDRRSDSLELVKFYYATGGPNWWKKWDLRKPMETWWGVVLNSGGCIIELTLNDTIQQNCKHPRTNNNCNIVSGNNLIGNLEDWNLSNLELINLSNNKITGPIIDFKYLINLQYLYIERNQLSSGIPDFNNLFNLRSMSLIGNNLSNEIPNFLKLTNLRFLLLSGNNLKGSIPNFSNLPNLIGLDLAGNKLEGKIPNFSLISNLEWLTLYDNNLTGEIPNFENISKVYILELQRNQLSGNLPKFEKLTRLRDLLIDNNNITGLLPDYTLTHPRLGHLFINENSFTFDGLISHLDKNKVQVDRISVCPTCTFDSLRYRPQQKIYTDTTIFIPANATYTLDLKIDDTVTTSTYTWYKNNILYKTIKGSNKLPFTPFTSADAGTYTVKITNPHAPQLTLESHPIRLVAGPSLVCDRKADSLELVRFYNATGGPNWTLNWDLNKPINTWRGISLNSEGCVITISLQNNNLIGSLTQIILPFLITLNLSHNQLSSMIPNFDSLSKLQNLDLSYNQLTSHIPNFKLSSLQYLSLSVNQINGIIPNFENLLNLKWLFLENNLFSGDIPNFDKLSGLQILALSSNQLTGSIPNFDKLPNLITLGLASNQFSGTIPNFEKLLNLRGLNLFHNQLTGTIPFLNNLSKLISLDWAKNNFTFQNILPNFELNLNNLNRNNGNLSYSPQQPIYTDTTILIPANATYTLDLKIDDTVTTSTYTWYKNNILYKIIKGSNKLPFNPFTSADAGTYTVKITNPHAPQLTLESYPIRLVASPSLVCDRRSDSLELVKFYDSTGGKDWTTKWDLSKPISSWWGITLSSEGCVTKIELDKSNNLNCCDGNNLIGVLPYLRLPELKAISVFNNQLAGSIPDLNEIPKLEDLVLSKNKFTGSIPDFTNLPVLKNLAIQDNPGINGSIPDFKNLSGLETIKLERNGLTGAIPDFSNTPKLKLLNLFRNSLNGPIPDFKNLTALEIMDIGGNSLTGTIPNFNNLPKLERFIAGDNMLSGALPDFSLLPNLKLIGLNKNKLNGYIYDYSKTNRLLSSLDIFDNQYTFYGLIQHTKVVSSLTKSSSIGFSTDSFTYSPQAKVFVDTTIYINQNSNYTLDLKFDDTVTTSTYTWYKNNVLYKSIKGSNKLPFAPFTSADAGTYTVKITNPHAPQLTLESHPIRLNGLCHINLEFNITIDPRCTAEKMGSISYLIKENLNEGPYTYTWFKNDEPMPEFINKSITTNQKVDLPLTVNDVYQFVVTGNGCNKAANKGSLSGSCPELKCDRRSDSLELVRFFNSCGGNEWKIKWDFTKPINTWYGIQLTPEGCVKTISLQDNRVSGNLIALNLSDLQVLDLPVNNLGGPLPAFNQLKKLTNLNLRQNAFTGSFPNIDSVTELTSIILLQNNLTGNLPILNNHKKLRELNWGLNNFKGYFSDNSVLHPLLISNTFNDNKLTFEGLIQNIEKVRAHIQRNGGTNSFVYAPQQKIYYDTTIMVNTCSNYTIDLKIDDTVSTSTYTWYKNGIQYKTIKGSNKLPFTSFMSSDAGTYTVKITNPHAPQLTLESHPIRLVPNGNNFKIGGLTSIPNPCPLFSQGVIRVDSVLGGKGPYTFRLNNGPAQNFGQFSRLASGQYIVTITDAGGCTISQNVELIEPAKINAAFDNSFSKDASCINGNCNGGAKINVSGGTDPLNRFQIRWASGETTTNQLSSTASKLCPGLQEVTVQDGGGCSIKLPLNIGVKTTDFSKVSPKTDSIKVSYSTKTTFNLLENDLIPGNLSITVKIDQPNSGIISNFSQSSGLGIFVPSQKFPGKEIISYSICSADCPDLCVRSNLIIIVESPCSDKTNLKLPNIIFPNASGINRYFHVEAIEKCPNAFGLKPSSLKVFNRWGDLVYSSPEYKNDWDGENNKGQPLPDGTYYYLLDMGSQGGPVKGWVVIMR